MIYVFTARDLSEVKGIDSSLRYHSHAGELSIDSVKCWCASVFIVMHFVGFFTVNETTNSNMYFWFFPAKVSNSFYKTI